MRRYAVIPVVLLFALAVRADYLGSWRIDDYLPIKANTHQWSTGAAYDASSITYRIYEDETNVEIVTDTAMTKFDSQTGVYLDREQLTVATGFEAGKTYTVLVKATVGGVAGTCSHTFQILAAANAVDVNVADFFAVDSGTTYAASVAGSVVKEIADNAGGSSLDVGDIADEVVAHMDANSTQLAAIVEDTSAYDTDAEYAAAVWNAAIASYGTAGTYGEELEDLDPNIMLILVDTAELQTDWTDGGRLDLILDGIAAGADVGAVADEVVTHMDANSTQLAAIVADTGELQTDWHDGGRLDLILDAAGAAGDPWITALPGAYGAGTAGYLIGTYLDASIADVNTTLRGDISDVNSLVYNTYNYVSEVNETYISDINNTLNEFYDYTTEVNETYITNINGKTTLTQNYISDINETMNEFYTYVTEVNETYITNVYQDVNGIVVGDVNATVDVNAIAEAVRIEMDANSVDLNAVLADTNELQTDWTNGGRLDVILDAIKAMTDLMAVVTTTVATATDANEFTITAGQDVNDAYTMHAIMVQDATDSHAEVRWIEEYVTSRSVLLDEPLSFTPEAGDKVWVLGPVYGGLLSEILSSLSISKIPVYYMDATDGGTTGGAGDVTHYQQDGTDP